jgi:hypothetical protein
MARSVLFSRCSCIRSCIYMRLFSVLRLSYKVYRMSFPVSMILNIICTIIYYRTGGEIGFEGCHL